MKGEMNNKRAAKLLAAAMVMAVALAGAVVVFSDDSQATGEVTTVEIDDANDITTPVSNQWTYGDGTLTLTDNVKWVFKAGVTLDDVTTIALVSYSLEIAGASTLTLSAATVSITTTGNTAITVSGKLTIDEGTEATVDTNAGIEVASGATISVKEGGTLTLTGTLENEGSIIVGGEVEQTTSYRITNDGTITLVSTKAIIPAEINGSGTVDATGIQSDGEIGGNYNTNSNFTYKQSITATKDVVLEDSAVFTIRGTLIIPEGVTLTIQDNARLIIADATGLLINYGTIVVENKTTDGALYLTSSATIQNNGDIVIAYDGEESDKWSMYARYGKIVNNGTLTVSDESSLIIGENDCEITIDNEGSIIILGEICNRSTSNLEILNAGLFQMSGRTQTDFTIYLTSTSASVEIVQMTNTSTENMVAITISDAEFKTKNVTYQGPESTVAISAGANDIVSGVTVTLTTAKVSSQYYKYLNIEGIVSADTTEEIENPTVVAGISLTGDNTVTGSLGLGENVNLTISGILSVSGTIAGVSGSAVYFGSTSGNTLTVTGEISLTKSDIKDIESNTINSAKYEIAQTIATDKIYVYTTLADAVEDGAAKISVLGENDVSADLEIESRVTVTVETGATLNVKKDADVVFDAGAVLKNNGTIAVTGSLYVEDYKTALKPEGTVTADVVVKGDYDRTYTSLANALASTTAGTVELSQAVTLSSDLTIPEGVTVDTNGFEFTVSKNCTLTIEGDLYLDSSNLVLADATTPDKDGAIVLKGSVSSTDELSNVVKLNESTYTIPGAYYEVTVKTAVTYFVEPVSAAAEMLLVADDATITLKGESLALGTVSFIGLDGEDAKVVVETGISSGVVTLDLVTVEFTSGKSIAATFKNTAGSVEVSGTTGTNFKIASTESDDADVLTVYGAFTTGAGKFNVQGNVSVSGANISVATVAGTLTVVKTSTLTDLTVDGTVDVSNAQTLNATTIAVNGALNAAEATTSTTAGTVSAEKILVGVPADTSLSASASVSGKVTASEYSMVAAGTSVPESMTEDIANTAYYVEGNLYMTVYVTSGNYDINDIEATVENAVADGWYVDGDKDQTPIDDGVYIGVTGYEKVNAIVDYNIYSIEIVVGSGIENVAVDGMILEDGTVSGLKAGTHTVTWTIKNGYSGTPTLYVDGVAQTGFTINCSGTTTSYTAQLSGVQASGYPEPKSDDKGTTLTDYLLIVLVVLIAIMAIMVALRLMRS